MILGKGNVSVAVMNIVEGCIKMMLPNGKIVDILSEVMCELRKWLQDTSTKAEAGGYIVGYQHSQTGNITLEDVSTPYSLDKRTRTRFVMHDPRHRLFLFQRKFQKSYYMGVWHTHPQNVPIPSSIDWDDWYGTLEVDKTGCEYAFFVILGISEMRVWVGDFRTKIIIEIQECQKQNGIYLLR